MCDRAHGPAFCLGAAGHRRAPEEDVPPKTSAALLLYRRRFGIEVLLVHPGGPYWAKKDAAAWSLPKGEVEEAEDPLAAAQREFTEETGMRPSGRFQPLEPVRQPGGKLIVAWAVEGDFDARHLRSQCFTLEWPPKSGRIRSFPEVDRAKWFSVSEARTRLLPGQVPLLDQLTSVLAGAEGDQGYAPDPRSTSDGREPGAARLSGATTARPGAPRRRRSPP